MRKLGLVLGGAAIGGMLAISTPASAKIKIHVNLPHCVAGCNHPLIGGPAGVIIKKDINPVVTPVLKGTVVAAGAVVGAAGGTLVGAPAAGAAVGAVAGNAVNNVAAGQR